MLCILDVDTSDHEQAAKELRMFAEVAIERARLELRSRKVPFLYASGVKYVEQDARACAFRPPSDVLERRGGDCKQLTVWRIAELREAGINATPRIVWTQSTDGKAVEGLQAHMMLRLPDNNLEDPSINLGMVSL